MKTKTKDTVTSSFTDRTFGIEIELSNYDSTALTMAMAEHRVPRYSSAVTVCGTGWKTKYDGSLTGRNTIEIVSPILAGQRGMEQAGRMVNLCLPAAGAETNYSCGLHVHIGIGDLNANDVRALLKRYVKYELWFDSIMPAARRSNHQYANSLITNYGTAESAFTAYDNAKTIDQLNMAANFGSRYTKINLCAFAEHGTVEFRHHFGTADGEAILRWVQLCQYMVELSRRNHDVTPTRGFQKPIGRKAYMFPNEVSDELSSYYQWRADYFAKYPDRSL